MTGLAMAEQPIAYSQLRPTDLMRIYNEHALALGEAPMKRPLGLCHMAERLALIRTRRPPIQLPPAARSKLRAPRARSEAPIRDAIVDALCEVAFYIDKESGDKIAAGNVTGSKPANLISVGFSYAEIAARLKKRFRKSRMNVSFLWVECSNLRRRIEGYERYSGTLPDKRQRLYHRSPANGKRNTRR